MNWILENWEVVLTLLAVVGTLFGVVVSKVDKLKKELTEFKSKAVALALAVKAARDEASPNGKKISTEEAKTLTIALADTVVELVDVGEAVGDVIKDLKKK